MKRALCLIAVLAGTASLLAAQSRVTKEEVPGIRNLARLETTVACAGAITPSSMTEIKKMGFKSVINLRQATEAGADIEGHTAAAKAASLNYIHVPLNGAAPDAAAVDKFLKAIQEP